MAPLMHPGPLWDHFLSHPANFLPLPYAVAQLPAPQPPLSDLKLKLLHHTHRLLQDLAHLLKVTPLVQAAARLSSSIQALPEDAAHQPLVQHLTSLVQSAAHAPMPFGPRDLPNMFRTITLTSSDADLPPLGPLV